MGIKAKIASLVVDLSANSAKYNAELDKSRNKTKQWSGDVKKIAKIGGIALAGAATASAGALTVLTARSIESVSATAEFADKLGMSTKMLAAMRLQAEQNSVAVGSLDGGLERLARRASQAADGTGMATRSFKELKLDAKELSRLSPDKQFHLVADALERVNNQNARNRLASKIFGNNANDMINMMKNSAAETARAADEADRLGLAVSRVDAAKIEAAKGAGDNARRAMEGLGNTLAIKVAPFIADIKNRFYEAALQAGGFSETIDKSMKWAVKAVGWLSNSVRGMQVLWKGAQLLVATFVSTTLSNLEILANQIVKVANLIPRVNVKLDPNSGLALYADIARNRVSELKNEMQDLVMKKLPSENLEEYVSKVQEVAQKTAEEAAKTKESLQRFETVEDFVEIDVDKIQRELDRSVEAFADAYQRRQDMLNEALLSEQITHERHWEITQKNFKKFQDDQAEYKRDLNQMMLADSQSFFANMATLSQSGNKRLASIGKAAARISVIMGTIDAAQSSFAHAAKWGGYPAGVAAAAAATVAGMMRLRQINTAGSGSLSSGSGGFSGGTTFDQNLPNSSITSSNIPGASERRETEGRVIIQGDYYAQGSVQAMDSQSFSEFAQRNRTAIVDATEAELNEYGRSLAG